MKIKSKCIVCEKKIFTYHSRAKRGEGQYCSRSCLGKSRIGKRNSNWRGGIIKRPDGRIYVYAPGHPNSSIFGGSHILSYRLKASQILGRPLLKNEIVHHKNNDHTDNRSENLEIMTQSDHAKEHVSTRVRLSSGRLS